MIYIGSEQWTSKRGTTGWSIYLMEDVPKDRGVGARPKMIFYNGSSRVPSTDSDHYNEIFRAMKTGTEIKEIFLNERGFVVGCQLAK